MGTKPLSPLISQWVTTGTQIFSLVIKTSFFCWLFIWIRWTFPRVRYDQLMTLGWKFLLPLGMINLVITVIRVMGNG
ncbi:MAG TPA: NADH-quinone oxidoreductase subunit H [bacterium]|nr:NADH-quinone oxidoreductase subunit H [bacterium]